MQDITILGVVLLLCVTIVSTLGAFVYYQSKVLQQRGITERKERELEFARIQAMENNVQPPKDIATQITEFIMVPENLQMVGNILQTIRQGGNPPGGSPPTG